MLVFRGSPKTCRRSLCTTDSTQQEKLESLENAKQFRQFPKSESKILDAPRLKDDYYLNIMDWGQNNILAVALGSELYLWNAESRKARKLMSVDGEDDYPTSVAWSQNAKMLAVGLSCSELQLWDAETSQLVRRLEGHENRVGILAWNGHLLTSGSRDRYIINHDVRSRRNLTSCIRAHNEEVCGLKWSSRGNLLASGGNDNIIHIWEASNMRSSSFLHRFTEHHSAVKAFAWSPYEFNILASGGGTNDRCIKIWNSQTGKCLNSIDTKAQVCGLQWNRHHNEILSGHGFSLHQHDQTKLCLWKYPSLSKIGASPRHESRVLHLAQSPDGLTVVSAETDETLRFWETFGPPRTDNSRLTDLDSLLSFKRFQIR
ncbi:PREDICTED: cell division cycle 20.2, cofactor of APC complex-like isoform X1 [Nelumbo nucifera]|nr:PREDICTED: cell division cycle 20.2, cofactor of APC complex-like isoform X1 [Nelumbo nucifera]